MYLGDVIRMRAVEKHLPEGKGLLLDAGCEEGIYKGLVEKKGYTWLGIDNKPVEGVGLKGDITDIPFEDNHFEAIICIDVIEHVEDDLKAMQEMRRVLKQDGVLIIHVPNFNISHLLLNPLPNDYHVRDGYEFEQIINLIKEAGFPSVEVHPTFKFFEALAWDMVQPLYDKRSVILKEFIKNVEEVVKNLLSFDEGRMKSFVNYGWLVKVRK